MPRSELRANATVVLICLLLFPIIANPSVARAVGEPVNGFPNWAERVVHEWMNRARVDPQVEMSACGAPCLEHACYGPMPPLTWSQALNRSARFHSDEMVRQGYFAHDSACTVVPNINALYPTSCNGAASCACVGGTTKCSPNCTDFGSRVELFGASPSGEIIVSTSDPDDSFYIWLFEQGDTTSCQFTSRNGHRWLILQSTGSVGVGVAGFSTGDFGDGAAATKIPSGSHYPQQAASVDIWANWYDTAAPSLATVNVDGTCNAMTLRRGTATNGAWSATVSGVGSGCHRYFFNFRDASGATVTYPTTGSLAIGSGAGCPDWDASRPPACGTAANSPTPTASPSPLATQTRTASPTASRTATVTATASRTRTASATASATPSSTPPPTGPPVSGYVRYYSNGLAVAGIDVHASGAGATTSSSSTDASGHYVLSNVPTQSPLISADATGGTGNAISALDAAYVLQYVAALRHLSPEQILACDVTGNGTLSALDATMLLQYAAGLITTFPVRGACNSDWVFIPNPAAAPNQTLIEPQTSAGQCVAGGIAYPSLTAPLDEQNFSALVFGDCTGNWQPPASAAALRTARGQGTDLSRSTQIRRLPGGRVVLSVAADRSQPTNAAQIDVLYDAAALRLVTARPVGRARHAAVAVNSRDPGLVRLAIASGTAIPADGRPMAVLVFDAPRKIAIPTPSVSVRLDQ